MEVTHVLQMLHQPGSTSYVYSKKKTLKPLSQLELAKVTREALSLDEEQK